MMVFEGPEVGAVDEGHPIAIERAKDRQGYLSKRRERSGSSSSSSTLSPVNLDEDKDWLDVEPDYEETTFRSLVDEAQFTDILSMLDHVKEISSIDFLATCRTFDLDHLETLKLVNYIRSESRKGNLSLDISNRELFMDDRYLIPVLDDDALLYQLDELPHLTDDMPPLDHHHELTEARLVEADQRSFIERNAGARSVQQDAGETFNRATLQTATEKMVHPGAKGDATEAAGIESNDGYFDVYGGQDIHKTMVQDRVRTGAYDRFIRENSHLFQGKRVLDVGCGTGILSLMCARAGAKQVVSVDNAKIIDKAKRIARDNGFGEVITFVKGNLDDIELPCKQFDVIVSEWMGYGLLYEGMLATVLRARDKYLKPGGVIVPSHTMIRLAAVSDQKFVFDEYTFWHDTYGFNLGHMLDKSTSAVRVAEVPRGALISDAETAWTANLETLKTTDILGWRKQFRLPVLHNALLGLHGFALWFDMVFTSSGQLPKRITSADDVGDEEGTVAFTTGPYGDATHWCQSFLPIRGPIEEVGVSGFPLKSGQHIQGSLEYAAPEKSPRDLHITVKWMIEESTIGEEKATERGEQTWVM